MGCIVFSLSIIGFRPTANLQHENMFSKRLNPKPTNCFTKSPYTRMKPTIYLTKLKKDMLVFNLLKAYN